MRNRRCNWARVGLVVTLAMTAALGGIWSAQAGGPATMSFKQGSLIANYYGTLPNGQVQAHITAYQRVYGPGVPTDANWISATATMDDWNAGFHADTSADNRLGRGTVTVDPALAQGSAQGSIQGYEEFWNWSTWQSGSGPTTLTVAANLVGGDNIDQDVQTFHYSSPGTSYRIHGVGRTNYNPTGTMSVTSSLTGTIYAPPGAPISDGQLGYWKDSTLTIQR